MLVFVTPKRSEEHLVPYSYRTRATIVSENIFDSRVTDDIRTLQQNDVAVLGKRHTREDAEYCIKHDIKYIVDVADDKFAMFKHWYHTIPKAIAVTTTCQHLRTVILDEVGKGSVIIPDPTERKRGVPKFEVKETMKAFYYGAEGNYRKIDWLRVKSTLNSVRKTRVDIMTNKSEDPPKAYKYLNRYGQFWLTPEDRIALQKEGVKEYTSLINWNFDKQEQLVNESDFVLLPVTSDRESRSKGNNRPIDALQQGRIVLTNPGIKSYEDLKKYLYIGDFYTTYKLMLENPEEVISKITNAQTYINEHYTPKAIGLKWKRVYDRLHK